MIHCHDLHKSYPMGRGRKHVLNGLNFHISPGERVGFLGRNGAGKTTLIKLIGGVEMPTSGKVRRDMTVSWPLGFGGGFQGSLTGYDNARFIARIGHGAEFMHGKYFAVQTDAIHVNERRVVEMTLVGERDRREQRR